MTYWLIADTISFVLVMIFNVVGTVGVGPVRSMREIAKNTPSTFRPAAFSFLIWPVIYLGQLVFLLYSWFVADTYVNAMWIAYPILCFFQMIWIVRYGMDRVYESCFYLFFIVSTLVYLYGRVIGFGYFYPWLQMWAVVVPWSIFFGWSVVALVANLFAADIFAKDPILGTQPRGELSNTVVYAGSRAASLVVYGLWFVIALFLFYFKDVFFVGAMCWGFLGVICSHETSPKLRKTLWLTIFLTFVMVGLRYVFYLFFAY